MLSQTPGCPDEERLAAFALEALQHPGLEAHLDVCPRCRFVVSELLQTTTEEPHALASMQERYQVRSYTGAGGMGRVFAAYDVKLKRQVALKLVHSGPLAGDATPAALLLREAQALARLSHPNVVQVYDVTSAGDDVFISMEYVAGQTLSEWLSERPRSRREVVETFLAAGEGLAAIHDAGLFHRDFKPSNVLVGADGCVKISDFGLAALAREEGRDEPRGGTPAYLAPERLRGQPGDDRSDQYSFFAALFEALCGVRLSSAATADGGWRFPGSARVSRRLKASLRRGLSVDPARRFPGMRAALHELDRPFWKPVHPVRAAALVALTLVAAGAVWQWRLQRVRACEARGEGIRALWSPARQRALHTHFEAAAGPEGLAMFSAVERAVEAFSASWSSAMRDACLEPSPALALARAECLSQRHAELDALLGLLQDADRPLVFDAPRAAQSLSHPGTCAAEVETHANDPRAQQLAAVVGRLKALASAGKSEAALALSPEAEALAAALGRKSELASLLILRGRMLYGRGEQVASQAPLFEAAALAQEAREEALAVKAWLLVSTSARGMGKLEEAARALRMAEVLAPRATGPLLQLELRVSQAILASQQGAFPQLGALLQQALERAGRLSEDDSEDALRVRLLLGHALFQAGRFEDALRVDRALLEVRRRQIGDLHPAVAELHASISASLGALGRFDEALPHAKRAQEVMVATLGDKAPRLVSLYNNLAALHADQGRYAEAIPLAEQGLSLARQLPGADVARTARLTTNLGVMQALAGDLRSATRNYEEALAMLARRGGDSPDAIITLSQLSLARLAEGRLSEAKRTGAEAVALLERLQAPVNRFSVAYLALGAALSESGEAGRALRVLQKGWGDGQLSNATSAARALWRLHLGRALCESAEDCVRGRALLRQGLELMQTDAKSRSAEASRIRRWAERRLAAK